MSIVHAQSTIFNFFNFENLTHTMVAGVSGGTSGKSLAPSIGSISPLAFPDTFGRAIFDFRNNTSGQLDISMDSAGGSVPETFWTICKFLSADANWDSREVRREDFTFTTNGTARWTLAGQPSFLNGFTYLLDWT